MSLIFETGKELLDEKNVQIVCGVWVGIGGREEILWTGGGQADSSGGVRGKALWGYFDAEKNRKYSNLVIWYNTITKMTNRPNVQM